MQASTLPYPSLFSQQEAALNPLEGAGTSNSMPPHPAVNWEQAHLEWEQAQQAFVARTASVGPSGRPAGGSEHGSTAAAKQPPQRAASGISKHSSSSSPSTSASQTSSLTQLFKKSSKKQPHETPPGGDPDALPHHHYGSRGGKQAGTSSDGAGSDSKVPPAMAQGSKRWLSSSLALREQVGKGVLGKESFVTAMHFFFGGRS